MLSHSDALGLPLFLALSGCHFESHPPTAPRCQSDRTYVRTSVRTYTYNRRANQPTNQPTLRPSPSLIRRKRSIHHGRLRVPTFPGRWSWAFQNCGYRPSTSSFSSFLVYTFARELEDRAVQYITKLRKTVCFFSLLFPKRRS